jgi:murein DD-endopeptidase MepM/ murein hydrolase activator NlpD
MKHQKIFVRIVCVIMTAAIVLGFLIPLTTSVWAEDAAAKRAEAQALMKQYQSELEEIKKTIAANKDNLEKQEAVKASYRQQQNTIKSQIELLNTQISDTEAQLTAKQAELEQKVLEVAAAKDAFEQRLEAMYTTHNQSSLATLLGVTSFAQMLRFAENLQRISTSDTQLIENLRAAQAAMEQQAAEIQTMLDELSAQKVELDAKTQELAASIAAANNAISATEATIAANEEASAEKAELYKQASEEWRKWAYDISGSTVVADNGEFIWPIPGKYGISSDYGVTRTIYGVTDTHRGMDIPAAAGTPIIATAGGTVSTAAHWSYGTCVKISHGGGFVTIYGHMSARAVSDGQVVAQGDVIGYVGSTGNSTGNHLHFELDVNGSPTSVRPYLSSDIISALYWT